MKFLFLKSLQFSVFLKISEDDGNAQIDAMMNVKVKIEAMIVIFGLIFDRVFINFLKFDALLMKFNFFGDFKFILTKFFPLL